MQRATMLIAGFLTFSLLIGDGFAASPIRGNRRCTRRSAAVPPPVLQNVNPPPISTGPAIDVPSPATSLEQRVAALEKKVAEMMRQQAELEAQQNDQSGFHGWGQIGSGGIRARLGIQSSWDD